VDQEGAVNGWTNLADLYLPVGEPYGTSLILHGAREPTGTSIRLVKAEGASCRAGASWETGSWQWVSVNRGSNGLGPSADATTSEFITERSRI
jgi:hypothetical protein